MGTKEFRETMNNTSIIPNQDLVLIASEMSKLQDCINNVIDKNDNPKNDPRMNDIIRVLVEFSDKLSDMKGVTGDCIGELIMDDIDRFILSQTNNPSK